MDIRLDGRTALITGGSKGLGLAMATEFATSGADVAILARDADGLAAAKAEIARVAPQERIRTYVCDVAQADAISATVERVMADFGQIDILVNNAGTSRAMPFPDATDEIFQADLDLKLFAAIRLSRLVWPGMRERKWGRIINVLNVGAKAQKAGGAPTEVSRAAGMALMKILSKEGAPHGILVNALLVGLIDADQHRQRHARSGANTPYDDYLAKMGTNVPLGRIGRPEEFAAMACFLCSEAASFISGTAINVDGGMSPVV